MQTSHFTFQNNLVSQIIIVLETRIAKIKRRTQAIKFNLILSLDYAIKPHTTGHISGKYLFKTNWLSARKNLRGGDNRQLFF